MVETIVSAKTLHEARTTAALAARFQAAAAKAARFGVVITAHEDATTLVARIDHGRWIADCACGSGVALERTWAEARCFGCGAVYRSVQWPAAADRIEAALVKRPALATRNWLPTERVADLEAENAARGIR